MAHIKNGLFTQVKGRLRDLIFFTRRGHTYARSRPKEMSNPNTPLQQLQRNRMRDVVAFYMVVRQSPLLVVWQWAGNEKGMSRMNLFVKLNIAAFDGNGRVTDYEKLHFSYGSLPRGDCFRAVWQPSDGTIGISWDNVTLLNEKRYADRFMAVVLYEDDGFTVFTGREGCNRRDGRACLRLPEGRLPPVGVYCFFASSGCRAYSGDVYCRLDSE